MKAAFLDYATIDASIDCSKLEACFDTLDYYATTQADELLVRLKNLDVVITNKVVLNQATLSQCQSLKLICIAATGTNNIDLDAAKKQGIAVYNVSGYSTDSVAQHVFTYLLQVVSQASQYNRLNQQKPWHQSKTFCQLDFPINQLAGKTIGILGHGNLGQKVAQIAKAFSMRVLIAERPNQIHLREGRVAFETMLQESDIISLHCPLTADTEKLFDAEKFAQLKPHCIFINTARGPIVDSQALADVLKEGKISHAIIDVLEQEPPPADHPLLQADVPNLTLTHHIAWGSLQAQQVLVDTIADNVTAHFAGIETNRVC